MALRPHERLERQGRIAVTAIIFLKYEDGTILADIPFTDTPQVGDRIRHPLKHWDVVVESKEFVVSTMTMDKSLEIACLTAVIVKDVG